VAHAIARQIAKSLPTLKSSAETVHLPERTLQRRLAGSGVSHSVLVDRVRRDLALKYIADAGRSVTEIAYLLHFSDSTAFHRAFKRWTGDGPQHYRRTLFGELPS
jgi:AraC-like DNA-binding protein